MKILTSNQYIQTKSAVYENHILEYPAQVFPIINTF